MGGGEGGGLGLGSFARPLNCLCLATGLTHKELVLVKGFCSLC